MRILVFAGIMAAALLCLIVRLIALQLVDGARYRAAAQENQIRLIRVSERSHGGRRIRGTHEALAHQDRVETGVTRAGHVLARSRPSFVVGLIPSEIDDLDREIAVISQTIGVSQDTLLQRLFHHHGIDYTSFAQIVANEPYGPIVLAVNLPVPTVARLSEILTDLPGIDLEAQPIRNYPNGDIGSHILGYVGEISQEEYTQLRTRGYSPNDVIGKDGLEAQYDGYLRGQPGGERIEVDASGQVVRGARFPQKPASPGDSLTTSIDMRLQRIVEEALANGLASWGRGRALSGAVVAEDPYTGEILALASFPNFDPNDFAMERSANVEAYLTSPLEPLFDRAIVAATPTVTSANTSSC